MIYGHRSGENVRPVNGCVPILVTDEDGSDSHVHFLALGPAGMVYDDAHRAVTQAAREAANASREWTYDSVKERLHALGFECLDVGLWEERRDG